MTTRLELESNEYQRRQAEALEQIGATLEIITYAINRSAPPIPLTIDPMIEDPSTWAERSGEPKPDLETMKRARLYVWLGNSEAVRIRKRALLSQPAMGDIVGVSGAAVSRWETGNRYPTGDRVNVYAAVLHRLNEEQRR